MIKYKLLAAFATFAFMLLPASSAHAQEANGVATTNAPSIFQAAGTSAASIQSTVDAFRAQLGTLNPNVAGSFAAGRREINWDGVPDIFSAPNNLPADFFNVNSPRGVVFETPGMGFQVSADDSNPTSTPVRFGNLNPAYPTIFNVFSPQRLFTALGSRTTEVHFFVPGSNAPALVRGFGAVFTDVDHTISFRSRDFEPRSVNANIEYYDQTGRQLFVGTVPASPGDGNLSFLGVTFTDSRIARVVIRSGSQALGLEEGRRSDLIVMDDFIYGEPQATP